MGFFVFNKGLIHAVTSEHYTLGYLELSSMSNFFLLSLWDNFSSLTRGKSTVLLQKRFKKFRLSGQQNIGIYFITYLFLSNIISN